MAPCERSCMRCSAGRARWQCCRPKYSSPPPGGRRQGLTVAKPLNGLCSECPRSLAGQCSQRLAVAGSVYECLHGPPGSNHGPLPGAEACGSAGLQQHAEGHKPRLLASFLLLLPQIKDVTAAPGFSPSPVSPAAGGSPSPAPVPPAPGPNATDAELLLLFKASFGRSGEVVLASWLSTTSPCSNWTGITCNSSTNAVTKM